ncbi:hypothetical protein BYT27DRAFT_7118316 [Phlegmacium glaucopus]|nr:hypothetical protein BYT27DRAFT_7118316 [Phlegmacium glaucopus]
MASVEHFTSPTIHEPLFDSKLPQYQQSSSVKKSGKSRERSDLPATDYNPFQNTRQPLTGKFYPTLVLQNTGSVARDHLASERTFLAYVRTSLGIASAGVALIQLFTMSDLASKYSGIPLPVENQRVQKFATPLGLSALGMAMIVLLIGVSRYFLVQHALPENKFPPARLGIAFISFGLGSITTIAFGALLSGKAHHA